MITDEGPVLDYGGIECISLFECSIEGHLPQLTPHRRLSQLGDGIQRILYSIRRCSWIHNLKTGRFPLIHQETPNFDIEDAIDNNRHVVLGNGILVIDRNRRFL